MAKIARWTVFIILTILVGALVGGAYYSSQNVQPIDGVDTFGILLLTVYLVLIYQRQNKILTRHEDVLEAQFEVQEASEVEPNIYISDDWSMKESHVQNLEIENTGGGDIQGLYLLTELNPTGDLDDPSDSVWQSQLTYHLASGDQKKFERDIRFNTIKKDSKPLREKVGEFIQDLSSTSDSRTHVKNYPTGTAGVRFLDLTRALYDAQDHSGRLNIDIRLFIVGYDPRGKPVPELLAEASLGVEGVSQLSRLGRADPELEAITIRPQLQIEEFGPTPSPEDSSSGSLLSRAFDEDSIGLEVENTGRIMAILENVEYNIRIFAEDGWENAEDFFEENDANLKLFGTSQPIKGKKEIRENEFIRALVRFETSEEEREIDVSKLTELIVEQEFENPFMIRFHINYRDETNNEYVTSSHQIGTFVLKGSGLANGLENCKVFEKSSDLNDLLDDGS